MPHIGNFPIPGYPKPLAVHPSAFVVGTSEYEWFGTTYDLKNRAALTLQIWRTPVFLPDKCTVTKLILRGYRDDALAEMQLRLYGISLAGGSTIMAEILADWTDGEGEKSETTITEPVIDNENHSYMLQLNLLPNDNIDDVRFWRAQIDWK